MTDQDTCHTMPSNSLSILVSHSCPCGPSLFVQMMTFLSCEQLAIYHFGNPMDGAHETSRTQSVCPSNCRSSTHFSLSSAYLQILTRLSHPPDTKRFTMAGRVSSADGSPEPGPLPPELLFVGLNIVDTDDIGGAQLIAFTPGECALGIFLDSQSSSAV